MENEEFYKVHSNNINILIKIASENGIISLIKEKKTTITPNYISNIINVKYLNYNVYNFVIKTTNNFIETTIHKNDYILPFKNVINILEKYSLKIVENYLKIKNNFYIDKTRTTTMDEIYLKSYRTSFSPYLKIIINNDRFSLVVDSWNIVEYFDIEHLINSCHLENLRRTKIKTMLKFLKFF